MSFEGRRAIVTGAGSGIGQHRAPAEIAGVVVWLLSDGASCSTGQTIYADGGYIVSS